MEQTLEAADCSAALNGTIESAISGATKRAKESAMTSLVLAEVTASISELKRNPMGPVAAGEGAPVAILNRNEPAFYCVPARMYEAMMDRLEDAELNAIADARAEEPVVKVALSDL